MPHQTRPETGSLSFTEESKQENLPWEEGSCISSVNYTLIGIHNIKLSPDGYLTCLALISCSCRKHVQLRR